MRKRYNKWIALFSLVSFFSLQGCNNFLDLKPKDVQVVSTIEDYRDLLASYMRLLTTVNPDQLPVLGDYFLYPEFNVALTFAFRTGELEYDKDDVMYYDASVGEYKKSAVNQLTWMGTADECWNRYYSFLGPINMIIEGITSAEGDDERLRDYVKGEALVWRAYSYFKLLQYFSPYDKNEYGVPVYLKPYEDPGNAMPKREKQTDVYARILEDCDEVFELLARTPTTSWNCAYTPRFVHSMLASVYCYKALSGAGEENDWQNALEHAEEAMKGISFVRDEETYDAMFNVINQQIFTNDEFHLRVVDGANSQIADFSSIYWQGTLSSTSGIEPTPSDDIYNLYRNDDVRRNVFFKTSMSVGPEGMITTIRYDKYSISEDMIAGMLGSAAGGVIMFFRSAEVQLIKAEALYRLGNTTEAKIALDEFKQGRYLDVENSYTESDLLDEILKERKLEFYQELDMWWLDMKRTGTRVERVVNGTLYVLEPNDYRYCFPIPESEMSVNKNMVQNPGWDQVNI